MSNMQPVSAERKLPMHAAASPVAEISEKQFLRKHAFYSALSSWCFAMTNATLLAVVGMFSTKALKAVEEGGQPLSKLISNRKHNYIYLGLMAFGGVCMGVSNWLGSKMVLLEWQLGAGKIQRKINVAEQKQATPAEQIIADAPAGAPAGNQPPAPDVIMNLADNHVERLAKRNVTQSARGTVKAA